MNEPCLDGCMLTPRLRIRQAHARKNQLQNESIPEPRSDQRPKAELPKTLRLQKSGRIDCQRAGEIDKLAITGLQADAVFTRRRIRVYGNLETYRRIRRVELRFGYGGLVHG